MLISNIRNPTDLENKRRLQQQLIDLEISNEAELERRVRDFKDPTKPLPVAPQYKSNAELRKDRIDQERTGIKNLGELGLDYTRSAELTAWLSSSEVDKLADFNANFKGIKKELTETTNPKLLTTDFLKNYLERYFEDLDVSYGRKFAQQTQRETQETLAVDDLIANIPSHELLDELRQQVINMRETIYGILKGDGKIADEQIVEQDERGKTIAPMVIKDADGINNRIRYMEALLNPYEIGGLEYTTRGRREEADEGMRRNLERDLRDTIKTKEKIQKTANDGFLLVSLIDLYKAVVPSTEFFNTLKLSLTIVERTDLVRRYARLFQKIKAMDTRATEELISEARSATDFDKIKLFYDKTKRALSFIAEPKNVDIVLSLNRNYERELNREGKEVELSKIKQFNDIQAQRAQEARENIRNFFKYPFGGVDVEGDEIPASSSLSSAEPKFTDYVARNFKSGEFAKMVEEKEDPQEKVVMREIEIQKQLWEEEKARKLAEKLARLGEIEAQQRQKGLTLLASVKQTPQARQVAVEQLQERREELARVMGEYYKELKDELYDIENPKSRVNTIVRFFQRVNIPVNETRTTGLTKELADEMSYSLLVDYDNWIRMNRIEPILRGELPLDYDYEGVRDRAGDIVRPYIYTSQSPPEIKKSGKDKLVKGVGFGGSGLKTALREHFKEDERELMEMAKSLKRHKKNEKKIDTFVESSRKAIGEPDFSTSESDEEVKPKKEQGGSLTFSRKAIGEPDFRHKRIKVGRGISAPQKESNYRAFGKYVIHIPHLLDKNIANFKYRSLGSIPSIRPLPVSDDYKEFLIDTLDNERPNERLLRKLPAEEQRHFERVVVGAGLNDIFRIKKTNGEEEKREHDRFNILRGEVLAGNNNEKVIKELRGLLIKFINEGKIRRQEGLNMLMEISAI